MKIITKRVSLIVFFSLLGIIVRSQNTQIQDLTWQVSGDSIFSNITQLSSMERFTYSNDTNTIEFLTTYFESLGLDSVYIHTWDQNSLPNIIAEKRGQLYPDSIIILGAHYDSYAIGAPGADDNASGTSGVMETARILASSDFEITIRFICFSGEELGLLGSNAYANQLNTNNENLKLMINLDMISYVSPGFEPTVNIVYNPESEFMYNNYIEAIEAYLPEFLYNDAHTSGFANASDHASFWNHGYPAIFLIDCTDFSAPNFNHNIHSNDDIVGISANSQYLAEHITKSVVISLCEYAVIIDDNQSIQSASTLNNPKVFPNPANDIIYIQIKDNATTDISIQIISAFGTIVDQFLINSSGVELSNRINIEHLPSGIYVINTLISDKVHSTKLIKL